MFCYGYNVYSSYLKKDYKNVIIRLVRNTLKLIIAFWISGLVYNFLIEKDYNSINYIKILFFLKLPPYSEFLAAFIVINILLLLFFNLIKKISQNNIAIISLIVISLLLTLIPYKNIKFNWSELYFNTEKISFPIISYLSLFLFGICFSKYKPKFSIKLSIVMCIYFFICIILEKYYFKNWIIRFPPSLGYIILSFIPIYFYYYITKIIANILQENKFFNEIIIIGRYTLYFLLMSNIIIFIKKWMLNLGLIKIYKYSLLLIYFEIVIVIYICMKIFVFIKKDLFEKNKKNTI